MPSCVVKSCKNYIGKHKKPQGITFHSFPRNNNRKDEWVQIIQNCRGENDWNPSSSSTICSAHFDDVDFITTVKGLRCLVPYAIPKRLLSNLPETQTQSSSSPIMQISPNVEGVVNDQQLLSTPSMASCLLQVPSIKEEIAPNEGVVDDQVSLSPISDPLQVPLIKVEFVLTGYCRLCAATPCDGNLVNIQSDDVLKQLVVNMSNRLNTKIDFSQQHLPTTICPVCVKQLYTAYDFVVGIDLAQTNLNEISIQKYKYQMPVNSILGNNMDLSNISLQQLSTNTGAATPPQSVELSTTPFLLDTPRERHLKHCLDKKKRIIEIQKKKLKTLNQKIRRLQNRNDSLKDILKIN